MFSLILFGLVTAVAGGGGGSIDCTIGETWIENGFRYECYSNGPLHIGFRPIGK